MVVSDEWLAAGIAVVVGLLIGTVLGWLARRVLGSPRVSDELHTIARPTGIFLFWFSVAAGVGIAVGIVSPASLDSIPRQVVEYLPRVLSAGLILLGGYALAVALGQIAASSLGTASGSGRRRAGSITRIAVMAAAVVLALAQIGVDVTILTILVAATAFGFALAAALLIGLGGKDVVAAVAAGRYVRRHVEIGYRLESGETRGIVSALLEATIEVQTDDGAIAHVPYTIVLETGAVIEPPTDA